RDFFFLLRSKINDLFTANSVINGTFDSFSTNYDISGADNGPITKDDPILSFRRKHVATELDIVFIVNTEQMHQCWQDINFTSNFMVNFSFQIIGMNHEWNTLHLNIIVSIPRVRAFTNNWC